MSIGTMRVGQLGDLGVEYLPFAAGPTPASITGAVNVTGGAVTPVSAGFITLRRTITNAEIIAGADINLINGLAGHWILPYGLFACAFDATAGVYGSTRTISLRHIGGGFTNDLVSPVNFIQAAIAGKRYSAACASVNINLITSSPDGVGIRAVFSGNNTGGNAANSGIWQGSFIVIQSPIPGF